ncbi:MAG TPA: glycosyltransferase family protein [Candidatus Limnocylindrales bacterium]|nr:glycosyltransferase family protein [Candidatus Limnocylindrales bacterium]
MAVVQARMTSARLPGKVLEPILGSPMLGHIMRRVARSTRVDDVVVATTVEAEDDPIVDLAAQEGWVLVRGSRDDVLDRYVQAAREMKADIVVRITSDCPLIDPDLVDAVVAALGSGIDYASNTLEPRTYPRGLDCEAMTRSALERASREDDRPAWREHVTPYIYRHPDRFRLRRVANEEDESSHRWCVDVPEDLKLVRSIYGVIGPDATSWREALAACAAHPEWATINAAVRQKTVGAAEG